MADVPESSVAPFRPLRSWSLSCNSNELQECTVSPGYPCWSPHVLSCVPVASKGPSQPIRFSGGSSSQGWLQTWIPAYQRWSALCKRDWNELDGFVACRQLLGNSYRAVVVTNAPPSPPSDYSDINGVVCDGTETMLRDCTYKYSGCYDALLYMRCVPVEPPTMQLRLRGGDSHSGWLEAWAPSLDTWVDVSNNSWTLTNSIVACQQLFGASYTAQPQLATPVDDRTRLAQQWQDVSCDADATELSQCRRSLAALSFPGVHLQCRPLQPQPTTAARLQDGRVEAYLPRLGWGAICNSDWTVANAHVSCQQMYGSGFTAVAATVAGNTTAATVADISCTGSESRLQDCDVSVTSSCSGGAAVIECVPWVQLAVPDVQVRLADASGMSGTLQVFSLPLRRWSSVCLSSNSASRDAACQQLFGDNYAAQSTTGLSAAANVPRTQVDCPYGVSTQASCSATPSTCGVLTELTCEQVERPPNGVSLRLAGGADQYTGQLQVWRTAPSGHAGWHAVCAPRWSWIAASITCRQLFGSSTGVTFPSLDAIFFIPSTRSALLNLDVTCTGNERELQACTNEDRFTNCEQTTTVALSCDAGALAQPAARLLTDGNTHQGFLSVSYSGNSFGLVCNAGWTNLNSRIACAQMFGSQYTGYSIRGSQGSEAEGRPSPPGALPVIYARMRCPDNADVLADCPAERNWCSYRSDSVYLTCQEKLPTPDKQYRLVGGPNKYAGRLQVFYGGQWGTVCYRTGWQSRYADVVCQSLFGTDAKHALLDADDFPERTVPTLFGLNANCTTTDLLECSLDLQESCDHFLDVAMACKNTQEATYNPGVVALSIGCAAGACVVGLILNRYAAKLKRERLRRQPEAQEDEQDHYELMVGGNSTTGVVEEPALPYARVTTSSARSTPSAPSAPSAPPAYEEEDAKLPYTL
eukprot:PLAT7029.2.p1 GENE.PLAT7029.2~~PLAT7029.2.p1  ORF type:complete len:1021 (-),score=250.71 PLAT7029.2:143-2917(-)